MKEFCKEYNITEQQFLGKEEIGGDLDLSNLTSIPEGFNPTVGGDLDLRNLTSIPEGFNPTVGDSLYLNNLTSIPEGFNPTVGYNLDLSNLTSIPEGFNPTVGGYLYLSNRLQYETKPFNKPLFEWENGKYIKVDGIFTEVLHKKGNIYKVKKLNSFKEYYLVSEDGFYAHGETLKQACNDLKFKIIAEKLKNEPINKDTILNVQYYRTVTGACEIGCKDWMKQNNIQEPITAGELFPILEKTNAYGFEKFKNLITF
jgi:hypothetical protein